MATVNQVIQGFFPSGLGRLTEAARSAAVQPRAPGAGWVQQCIEQGRGAAGAVQRYAAPHAAALQQRPSASGSATQLPPHLSRVAAGGGEPLPPHVRAKMEAVFGTSFADVRVHVGGDAPAIGALAFTAGSHIHFAPGHYTPQTAHGQRLLGHELTHVVQQRAGRVQNPFGPGMAVVHDARLEAEAERMAARVASAPEVVQPSWLRAAAYTVAGGAAGIGASLLSITAAPVVAAAATGAAVGAGIYGHSRALVSGARALRSWWRGPAAPAVAVDAKGDEKVMVMVSREERLREIQDFYDGLRDLALNSPGTRIRKRLRVLLSGFERGRESFDTLVTYYNANRTSRDLRPLVRSAAAASSASSGDEKRVDDGGDGVDDDGDDEIPDDVERKSIGPRASAIKATGTGGRWPKGNFVPASGTAKRLKSWSKTGNDKKPLAEVRGKYRGTRAVLHVHLNADGQLLSSHSGASIFYEADERLNPKPRQVYWDGGAVTGDLLRLLTAGFGGDSWKTAAGYTQEW